MNRTTEILIGVTLSGVAFGLVSIWWWALFGMNSDVGVACATTSFILFFGGMLGSV